MDSCFLCPASSLLSQHCFFWEGGLDETKVKFVGGWIDFMTCCKIHRHMFCNIFIYLSRQPGILRVEFVLSYSRRRWLDCVPHSQLLVDAVCAMWTQVSRSICHMVQVIHTCVWCVAYDLCLVWGLRTIVGEYPWRNEQSRESSYTICGVPWLLAMGSLRG